MKQQITLCTALGVGLVVGSLAWAAETNAAASVTNAAAKPKDYRQLLQRVRIKQQEKNDLDEVQKAINAFQMRFGQLPTELRELVDRGLLPELPTPPHGSRFFYDRLVGNVRLVSTPGEKNEARTNLPGSANLVTQPK